jgi:hypothetical protein
MLFDEVCDVTMCGWLIDVGALGVGGWFLGADDWLVFEGGLSKAGLLETDEANVGVDDSVDDFVGDFLETRYAGEALYFLTSPVSPIRAVSELGI